MSYYKIIEGVKMDGEMLDLAVESVKGRGDGRISLSDAHRIFDAVKDGNVYTDTEKATVIYLLNNFKWTDTAYDWFQKQLSGLTEHDGVLQMTPEEISRQHFPERDVLFTPEAQASRMHDLKTAMVETMENHDELGLIVRLATGERVQILCDFIEVEGEFVELKGGHTIPVRAIERVEI
jgi:hypothetical protein